MKLREFKFNSIVRPFGVTGLCIKEKDASITDKGRCYEGFISEVLGAIPIEWAEREIGKTWWYFDIFVIELKPEENEK